MKNFFRLLGRKMKTISSTFFNYSKRNNYLVHTTKYENQKQLQKLIKEAEPGSIIFLKTSDNNLKSYIEGRDYDLNHQFPNDEEDSSDTIFSDEYSEQANELVNNQNYENFDNYENFANLDKKLLMHSDFPFVIMPNLHFPISYYEELLSRYNDAEIFQNERSQTPHFRNRIPQFNSIKNQNSRESYPDSYSNLNPQKAQKKTHKKISLNDNSSFKTDESKTVYHENKNISNKNKISNDNTKITIQEGNCKNEKVNMESSMSKEEIWEMMVNLVQNLEVLKSKYLFN